MRITVELEVEIPDIEYNAGQLAEYLGYSFGETSSISLTNPFHATGDPETIFGTLTWR